jgi:hypothetical protein
MLIVALLSAKGESDVKSAVIVWARGSARRC